MFIWPFTSERVDTIRIFAIPGSRGIFPQDFNKISLGISEELGYRQTKIQTDKRKDFLSAITLEERL